MRILILALTILLCFATSYGQDTKPTKQETMDWIATKFENCLGEGSMETGAYWEYKFIKIKENSIYIDRIRNTIHTDKTYHDLYVINFNLLTRVMKYENGVVEILGTAGFITITRNDSNVENKSSLILSSNIRKSQSDETVIGFDNFLKFSCENDLENRMIKALSALSQFNIAELPKEKY